MRNGAKLALAGMGALTLAGCAGHLMKMAHSDCAGFGHAAGTPEYTQCVQGRFESRQRMLATAFDAPATTVPAFGSASETARSGGFLKRDYVSGLNRVCIYDTIRGDAVMTVGAAQMCPLSPR